MFFRNLIFVYLYLIKSNLIYKALIIVTVEEKVDPGMQASRQDKQLPYNYNIFFIFKPDSVISAKYLSHVCICAGTLSTVMAAL